MLALALGQFHAAGSLLEVFSVFANLPLRPISRCSHVVSQGCIWLHRQEEFADRGLEADLGRLLEAAQEWTFHHTIETCMMITCHYELQLYKIRKQNCG